MKKLLSIILAFTVMMCAFAIPVFAEMQTGDVNANGKIDATDALDVLKHAVNKKTFSADQKRAGDCNGDSRVDAADALLILKYAVKKISVFPVDDDFYGAIGVSDEFVTGKKGSTIVIFAAFDGSEHGWTATVHPNDPNIDCAFGDWIEDVDGDVLPVFITILNSRKTTYNSSITFSFEGHEHISKTITVQVQSDNISKPYNFATSVPDFGVFTKTVPFDFDFNKDIISDEGTSSADEYSFYYDYNTILKNGNSSDFLDDYMSYLMDCGIKYIESRKNTHGGTTHHFYYYGFHVYVGDAYFNGKRVIDLFIYLEK